MSEKPTSVQLREYASGIFKDAQMGLVYKPSHLRGTAAILRNKADKIAALEAENERLRTMGFADLATLRGRYDYGLAAFMLRDLDVTEEAGLTDLCAAMALDGTSSREDWDGLRRLWWDFVLRKEQDKEADAGQDDDCSAIIRHGPGHQSKTYCQMKGPHRIHEAVYGSSEQVARWEGDEVFSGFFDGPPDEGLEEQDDDMG